MVPRGEQGTKDGKEEMVTGTGTEAGTETRTSTGMRTRVAMGERTGAGTGTRVDMRVEGRESLGTFEVAVEVDWKTREGGRRQQVTSNHNHKTRRPN